TLIHTVDLHLMTRACHLQTPVPRTPHVRRLGCLDCCPSSDNTILTSPRYRPESQRARCATHTLCFSNISSGATAYQTKPPPDDTSTRSGQRPPPLYAQPLTRMRPSWMATFLAQGSMIADETGISWIWIPSVYFWFCLPTWPLK